MPGSPETADWDCAADGAGVVAARRAAAHAARNRVDEDLLMEESLVISARPLRPTASPQQIDDMHDESAEVAPLPRRLHGADHVAAAHYAGGHLAGA